MKNPILEHVHLFAKGLIVTVGIFVLTIFISDFYIRFSAFAICMAGYVVESVHGFYQYLQYFGRSSD